MPVVAGSKDFPEPVDGYNHRYAWNCTLINEMLWWPTLSRYARNRLNEMKAWNAKFLEMQHDATRPSADSPD